MMYHPSCVPYRAGRGQIPSDPIMAHKCFVTVGGALLGELCVEPREDDDSSLLAGERGVQIRRNSQLIQTSLLWINQVS
jgi:hypothetical protein